MGLEINDKWIAANVWGNKTRLLKLALVVFCFSALLTLWFSVPVNSKAAEITATIQPTATVAPMVVGKPMLLTDAQGNSFLIMQGSTFFVFPKEATQSPK